MLIAVDWRGLDACALIVAVAAAVDAPSVLLLLLPPAVMFVIITSAVLLLLPGEVLLFVVNRCDMKLGRFNLFIVNLLWLRLANGGKSTRALMNLSRSSCCGGSDDFSRLPTSTWKKGPFSRLKLFF